MATRRQLPRDLRPEVRAAIEPYLEPDVERLAAIAKVISQKRSESKAARVASGIERIWAYCEAAYKGEESLPGPWEKPLDSTGPLTRDVVGEEDEVKSKAVVRLTARYVDAGAAKLGEILLPTDDKAFSLKATPLPHLIPLQADKSQVVDEKLGPLAHPDQPEPPQPMIPGLPPPPQEPKPLTAADVVKQKVEEANEKAKKAETHIYDWLVESRYRRHGRRLIHDSARLGVGVLKGPFAKPTRKMAITKAVDGGINLIFEERIKPAVERKDPWNIFPDPACGEEIADGNYILERDFLTQRQVRALKKEPGYIAPALDQVIEEGPNRANAKDSEPNRDNDPSRTEHRYEVWYYTGYLEREDLACICHAAGKPLTADAVPDDQLEVPVVVTMINESIVKASLAMLDSGRLPYHNMPWQTRDGYWAGIGVAEQVSTPQAMVTAGTRAVLNNAGVAAGVQIVIDIDKIQPMDGSWNITPNKVWVPKQDAGLGSVDVATAFKVFEIPSIVQEIMVVIEYGMRLAEESTSIPLVTQGMSGPTQPDTFGGMQLQNNNANQLLRSIGYDYDDYITAPLIEMYYEWLLLDPNVEDDKKGDFEISAHGSAALVERAIQDQILPQLLPASLNPAYRMKPWETMAELLRSKRFDPRKFQYTDEEWQAVEKQQAPDPTVQAAQIRATAQVETAKMSTGVKHEQVAAEGVIAAHQIRSNYELALLEYANREKISLNDVKAQLAKTTMQLQTEQQLHADDLAADAAKGHGPPARRPQRMPPPVQLPGRAGNGRAFEQGPPR